MKTMLRWKLTALLIYFVAYWPQEAADAGKDVWGGVKVAAEGIIQFIVRLAS